MLPLKLVVLSMAMTSMVALAECSDSEAKANAPGGNLAKSPQRQQSDFRREFLAWAATQDWFALGATAEFGDLHRGKMAEKGMSFGYSIEFVDSKGMKHILGVGLGKEPKQVAKRSATMAVVEMCATKNIMMHGKSVSTDASGLQSRSVSGIVSGKTCLLRKTILKPGTEEKWILCVCTGMPYADGLN